MANELVSITENASYSAIQVKLLFIRPDSKLGHEKTENEKKPFEDIFITNEALKGFVKQNFLNFDHDD
ncbi:hypothetical protein BK138_34505 [Paenibacillus rhizosphaerae]|uniref:Uncharacterized protein n=1 Tax=Paenibacillus rhizosphaerae TaxID=297318 RepID=A0A1R1DYT2_9BACL|nr:hypothetical protein BK138_34505 [Paenibacillus rhizosphaerae]